MQYYKIIGKNYGKFNYKIGLNSLSDNNEDFNPKPECAPGGLYFCDIKYIFEYLNYGDKVCTIELPEDARVVRVGNKYKSDKIIIISIQDINLKNLIDLGADVHANNDWALKYAAENGRIDVVKLLLEHGADVNARDALKCAAENGRIDVVKLLLEHGANLHAKDEWALKVAIRYYHTEVVKLLLENGADVHKSDFFLLYPSEAGCIDLIKILIEYGMNVRAYNDQAIECAYNMGHIEVVKLLLEHGAKLRKHRTCVLL